MTEDKRLLLLEDCIEAYKLLFETLQADIHQVLSRIVLWDDQKAEEAEEILNALLKRLKAEEKEAKLLINPPVDGYVEGFSAPANSEIPKDEELPSDVEGHLDDDNNAEDEEPFA